MYNRLLLVKFHCTYVRTCLGTHAGLMTAVMENNTTHLTELVVRAVKEDYIDEIRMLRGSMQWQMVKRLAIMHRSLAEFCNDQVERRDVTFVPSVATMVWYDPRIIRIVGRFLGTHPIDLGLLGEVRPTRMLVWICAYMCPGRRTLIYTCVCVFMDIIYIYVYVFIVSTWL